ncbi:hypothetical protein CRUP_012589 [Coryphaenoides rupestris]|nr:hypothetical protein CRUP_012589 [Coryphaenoides rupestris]
MPSLLETHDSVASQECETPPTSPCDCVDHDPPGEGGHTTNSLPPPPEAIRMVGIRKVAGEHLGVTFRVEAGELVIARILHGGMVDQQGLLHVGDIIKEVVFFKCHYDYDPANDNLIPCKEAGLRFETGDILQIVNQDDLNWARHVEGGSAGLIPSQLLEEKRKAFVKRDVSCPLLFDRHELLIYEEVAKVPPFKRKTLVLIGAQGVGRRRLKNKLLLKDPQQFGTTIPFTSRKPRAGERESRMFAFTSRSKMEADVKAGRFLEHGEYDGNLYGTKTAAIHEVVEAGRICILDVYPQSLKVLRTSEFLPYVVFLKAPEFQVLKALNHSAVEVGLGRARRVRRLEGAFGHYFDLAVVNDNLDETYRMLKAALDTVSKNPQWVPVTWVF